jgi:hypothetical protein
MDDAEYKGALRRLGLPAGPMGERQLDGVYFEIYRLPDGTPKYLPVASGLDCKQRRAVVAALKFHLDSK